MKTKKNILFPSIFIILNILNLFSSNSIDLSLNEALTGSLADKSYIYYKLKLPELKETESKFLLIEARRNEENDFLDNVYSDPNLFISTTEVYPGPGKNTWSSSRFGDEIISINQNYVKSGAIFYMSIYCEFKCNYIIDAKLYNSYSMKEDKLYTVSLIEDDVIKFTFKTRSKFEKVKINCISMKMKPFRIFLAKNDPSSSNTITSNPIFINGYYFLIKKGDDNYAIEQQYEILIENKEFKQDLLFWIIYDDEETQISELSPLFGSTSSNSGNCYSFNIDKQHQNKNIIISTTLFNGNGYIKIGGWEKVKEMKVKTEDKNTYPVISDKSILLTEKDFKNYGDFIKDQSKDLHFCFIASEETSYIVKVYYEENSEQAQKLNYLLPGMPVDDILPGNIFTKYRLFYFQQNKDIKIQLKVKNGEPKLYLFYSFEDYNYLNKNDLKNMIKNSTIIKADEMYYRKYEILIEKTDNQCILEPERGDQSCKIFVVVDCEKDSNCLYELLFDHIGAIVNMKPKVLYSNVIAEKEVDKYQINIMDENTRNFAVILTQNTGNVKLKLSKYTSEAGVISLEDTEKYNKNYMPNIIEIKAEDFPFKNIKGIFEIQVIGLSFSSYNIYYYTFDYDNMNKLDHKTISMPLMKGIIIQDYIKDNHNIKVYSYDNSNVGNKKTDLFIYLNAPSYGNFKLFVFKNLNDYNYENGKVKGFLWESKSYNDMIHIEGDDPKYIIGNLYIMVYVKRYSEYNYNSEITYRKDNSIDSSFLLAITDEITPLTLIEGVEFEQLLTSQKKYQTFYYNHNNKDEDFILGIYVPYSNIKLGLKIGGKDYIYEKVISETYNLKVEKKDLNSYCPSSKPCGIEIKIDNTYDFDIKIFLLCKSSKNSIAYLNRNNQIEKRKILNNEKQYFVVEAYPEQGISLKINVIFSYGRGALYAKKIDKNTYIEQSIFPNGEKYEYRSDLNENEEVSIISIPYEDIQNDLPCRILVTVEGIFKYLGRNEGEYSISVSSIIDDIFPNKNYRLFVFKGEIKYYHFNIKDKKKHLSISMTNKEEDAYMYLNYAKINKEISDFQWKSEGSYNEYIDISVDDPFFVSRKLKSLDGDYYLAIRSFKDTYFNLYISDLNIKMMTINEEFPGTCSCEKEGDICYFRYENINSPYIADTIEQEMIFYFDFTYGSAEIFASLYQSGNNALILNSLPTRYNNDFKSLYTNQYLKIKLSPGMERYDFDSVLVLGTRCNAKSMFDFNVRPLLKSGEILQDYEGILYLRENRDNVIYISKNLEKPIKLAFYSYTNLPISYEAKALSGSAKIHCYINNEESDNNDLASNKNKEYKHISEFSVDEKDSSSYYDSISQDYSFRQVVFFEIKPNIDCLFSIFLHYSEEVLFIPMSKQIQAKFEDGKLYAYIELLEEYEEIIVTIDKMHSESTYTIYAKTSIVNSLNYKKMFSYSSPSRNNYDLRASTTKFSPSISIKIKNLPKDVYTKGKKVITMFYIEPEDYQSSSDKFNIIAYPNVDHYNLIYPQPNKYIYSSLTSKNVDTTVFTFRKQENQNNLLVIEISSCQGDFLYKLTNSTSPKKKIRNEQDSQIINGKGKKVIISKIENNAEYYLSIYGIEEDQMLFGDYYNTTDIDFLLYYYTTNENEYSQGGFDSKINYEIKAPGNIILKLPNLENIDSKKTKTKMEELILSVIITPNSNEFEYMDSICYLTRKYETIQAHNLYKNFTVNINMNKNEIEINKLNKTKSYYLNVLITNIKTGKIYALDPLEIIPNKRVKKNITIILLLIGIIILIFVIFYFYRKYRIAKAIVNYEKNDIKNMGTIPKSITELKKMQEEKNKKAKEKYNSLTEDSGEI